MTDILGVTGHRPKRLGGYSPRAASILRQFAFKKIEALEPEMVITGMALGWDQAIAQACIDHEIPFVAAVPFVGQDGEWPAKAQRVYEKLLDQADEVKIVSKGGFTPAKMLRRNEWIVDNCDRLLALWDGSKFGGTGHCVLYAEESEVQVINVWDDFQQFRSGGVDNP